MHFVINLMERIKMNSTKLFRNFFFYLILMFPLVSCSEDNSSSSSEPEKAKTVVDYYGPLQVQGNQLLDKNNDPVVLYGMSMFWSQWEAKFYNKECIQWLYDDWKCTIIRAAMAVEEGGYLENPQAEKNKIETVVQACIDLGIYVIIDWHSHNGEKQVEVAKSFFKQMAQKYGHYPNVIYEIYNEPLDVSWSNTLKPYSEAVIASIRSEDPDNLIVVGTPNWSQDVDAAALDPIDDVNVAYSLHFYTGTHREELREKAVSAIDKNLPLFVTEWGVSESNALGDIDYAETSRWLYFSDQNNLSMCNWSVSDKEETTSIIKNGSSSAGNWSEDDLTEAGRVVKEIITTRNNPVFELLERE